MPFEHRLAPDPYADARGRASSPEGGRADADDEPTTGVHRIDARAPDRAASDAGDEERIVALFDAHRTKVEALRCELALATRFLDALAAGDLARVRAIESASERAAPFATCAPVDFGCFGATTQGGPGHHATEPCSPEEDELEFPEVRALEARLRAALARVR